ncbi:HlyD family secretion protein [Deferribacter thermophilus]|uniref:HlyD family secretion protein n=1 Tax=Deferribacter thermophilus TaxID=53573 RepID=UPI003C1EC0E6
MGKKKKIVLILLIVGLIVFAYFAYNYLTFIRDYATSDAVFIRSDKITNVSFKRVAGKIIKMYKKEGDFVKKGEVIAEIDPIDYQLKYDQVAKKIESLKSKREQLNIQMLKVKGELDLKKNIAEKKINYLDDEIKSLKYSIAELNQNIKQLKRDYNRFKSLYEAKAVSKRKFEDIETNLLALQKKKKSLLSKLEGLKKQKSVAEDELKIVYVEYKNIDELKKSIESLDSEIAATKNQLQDLKNLIDYCKLRAPFDGKIGKKFVEVGSVIKSGFPIYSIVDTRSLYVEVLLEETKLKGVKAGCEAEFSVDSYPDIKFKGEVEEVYPASAATYALVPRDISAGEFTKVAQRIPVRVAIKEGDLSILKVGMGGEIKIKRVN